MAKEKTSEQLETIKQAIESKKLVIGTKRTLHNLLLGKLSTIFLTSNCPARTKERVKHGAEMAKVSVQPLNIPNDELGVICKKQYSISIAGLKK